MMNATSTEAGRPFVPGMGVDFLLPVYDPFTRLLGLDRTRRGLLRQADLRPGHRVLDIGCGTGTLAVLAKTLCPQIAVVGVDPDPKALARAARKALRKRTDIQFDRGFADALAYPDASFDRVFSSFMFHHLERDDKARTLREVRRVLKPAGSLHLLDFAGPDGSGHGARLRGLHAHHRLIDNGERTIAHLLGEAGFNNVTQARERVWLGLVQILTYRASRT